jgi:hypothetical protein
MARSCVTRDCSLEISFIAGRWSQSQAREWWPEPEDWGRHLQLSWWCFISANFILAQLDLVFWYLNCSLFCKLQVPSIPCVCSFRRRDEGKIKR